MTAKREECYVVMDGAGDPALIQQVWPRCAAADCNRLIRGATVRIGDDLYHKVCAPREESVPMPSRWQKPGDPTPSPKPENEPLRNHAETGNPTGRV